MSDRFEAFKRNLSTMEHEFEERNRLADTKTQETLDRGRADSKKQMEYVGKVTVRLDQRYKDRVAANRPGVGKEPELEGRSFGFDSLPEDDDAATEPPMKAPRFSPAPPAAPWNDASAAAPQWPTAPDTTARQTGSVDDDEDFEANGWLRG